ncbi:MAG: hypothetical protein WCR29_05510 [Bacteroidales bacterium]|nr:hypothetical protein [Bacteroidales bacterium]
METIITVFIITFALLLISFAFIGIKMFVKKGGEFKKQCSTVDPLTGERHGCTCQSNVVNHECDNAKNLHCINAKEEEMEEEE